MVEIPQRITVLLSVETLAGFEVGGVTTGVQEGTHTVYILYLLITPSTTSNVSVFDRNV